MVKRRIVLILLLGLLVLAGCDNNAEERDKAIAEAEEVEAVLSKAEAEFESVEAELSDVKAALKELRDETNELKEKLAAISETQKKTDSQLTAVTQAHNDLLKQINGPSDEQDTEIAGAEEDELRNEMDELKEKLAAVSEAQGKTDSELTAFTQAYNDLLEQVNGLSNERDLEIARGEKVSKEIEKLAERLREKTNEVSEYAGVVEELQENTENFDEEELDVIFVPTPQDVVDKMLELANVQKNDLVYDLGCGDGRIVVTAAKKYGCRARGYDINPKRVKESLENVEENNVKHLVRIERKDIFTLDLSRANVVSLYLLPELNVRLIPQLEKLKHGSRIVSHDFDMAGVKPDEIVTFISEEDNYEHDIYLWTTPLNKEDQQVNIE